MVGLALKWVRLAPTETNPGLFQVRFQYNLARRYLIWKSLGFVPFRADLTHFWAKSELHVVVIDLWLCGCRLVYKNIFFHWRLISKQKSHGAKAAQLSGVHWWSDKKIVDVTRPLHGAERQHRHCFKGTEGIPSRLNTTCLFPLEAVNGELY